ncbi:MAG TPA: AAA family ATPase [Egibacteraceae bacterium]|nr:AAA family ATPase [Egibacteraceae bacterium]
MRRRVLVVDRRPELADTLRTALSGGERPEIVHLRRTTQALDVLVDEGPWDVLVAGPSEESGAGLRRLAQIREVDPTLGLLVTVNGKEPSDLGALVKARPDELVRVPAAPAALRTALLATAAAAEGRRSGAIEAALRTAEQATRLGRIYTVSGPTGGCGKTTVAVNLAAMLGKPGTHRVVLVDLDVQFGEVTAALQLRPAHNLYDMVFDANDQRASGAEVAEALATGLTETPYGFSVLPAPRDPVHGDAITADDVTQLLAVLRQHADYVVVDTPTGLREGVLAALDLSEDIIVVSQVDVPGVANLRTFLSMLQRLGVAPEHQHVLLNKEMVDSGVTAHDAMEILGPVAGSMPFDAGVLRALNEGKPLCVVAPHHPVAAKLWRALAAVLPPDAVPPSEPTDEAPRKRRWWQRGSA